MNAIIKKQMFVGLNVVYFIIFSVALILLNIDWHSYKFYLIVCMAMLWPLLSVYYKKASDKPMLLKQCQYCEYLVPLQSGGYNVVEHCCSRLEKNNVSKQFGGGY